MPVPVPVPVVMRSLLVAALLTTACCGGDDGEPPVFPIDYAATYQEVRNCRFSLDHDLVRIRVLASPDALTAYANHVDPFPIGAVLLKEQFVDSDTTCAGPIVEITVMQKLAVGSSPANLDWAWQKVSPDHVTLATDIKRCTSCHTTCGKPPEGYDGTCTMP